ncbi:hypothetical protein DFH07DRAFT_765295 [Mycena maculata]|uniref:Uncharacterized protein n=1 Tax=Mycena maculata TaxID=230809 RepID=A0AAD7NYV6_9AGAR|nr:hypothetical protein DFH07DRAFT_765295 [Mycena maculata]
MPPPPLTSKHRKGLTSFELQSVIFHLQALALNKWRVQRANHRREQARQRMARTRAALKLRPKEEQDLAAERARGYQAKSRAKHREDLRLWEAQRRIAVYKRRYGSEAYVQYAQAKHECKRRAMEKWRARVGYDDHIGNARDGGRITS